MTEADGDRRLRAHGCPNHHWTIPGHHRCPTCGESQTRTRDLSDSIGEVVSWTESTAPPPGVRSPNPVAIVEFEIADSTVRAIGGLTERDVASGDPVRPVYVDELREPGAGIRDPESQSWDGYRFEPI